MLTVLKSTMRPVGAWLFGWLAGWLVRWLWMTVADWGSEFSCAEFFGFCLTKDNRALEEKNV